MVETETTDTRLVSLQFIMVKNIFSHCNIMLTTLQRKKRYLRELEYVYSNTNSAFTQECIYYCIEKEIKEYNLLLKKYRNDHSNPHRDTQVC